MATNENKLYVLGILRGYHSKNHILPSYSTIMHITGHRSKSQIHNVIHQLIDDNYLSKTPDKKLIPTQKFFGDSY